MSSDAQITANRANAQLSTGPKTPEGKTKSSLNAIKTGLTGRTVLLPGDDAAAYQKHVQRFLDKHQPANDDEQALTQSLADTEWRLLRIPALEMGIYALGQVEFTATFDQEDASVSAALVETQTFLVYQKQLNNLSIQELRLRKQRETDLAALQKLQHERKEAEQTTMQLAAQAYRDAKQANQPFDPSSFGFDFSAADIEAHLEQVGRRDVLRKRTFLGRKDAA